jgi:hypothetical protein
VWLVHKDFEGGDRDVCEDIIPEFTLESQENPGKILIQDKPEYKSEASPLQ